MSIVIKRAYRVDVSQPMLRQKLRDVMQTGDRYAHRIEAELLQQGAPMTGIAQAHGYLCRADGATVVMDATVNGNTVSLLLAPACYEVPGPAQLIIRVTQGSSIVTALWLEMLVAGGVTDVVVDPGNIVPALPDLLAQIARLENAAASVENTLTALGPLSSLVQLPVSWVLNTRIDYQSGLPVADTNYCATLPIPLAGDYVRQVDVYTASASDSSAIAFYDESGTPIFFQNITDGIGQSLVHHTVNVPEGAFSMRFSCRSKNNMYQSACASLLTPLSDITAAIQQKAASEDELDTLTQAVLQTGWNPLTNAAGFVKHAGCYVHSNGSLILDAGFDTWVAAAPEDLQVYAAPSQRPYDKYVSLALYNGQLTSGDFVARYRSYKSENTLPSQASPRQVKRGMLMAVSVHAGDDFSLMCSSALACRLMSDGLSMGESQLRQVRNSLGDELDGLRALSESTQGRLISLEGYHLLTADSSCWQKLPGCYVNGEGGLVAHDEFDTYVRVIGTNSAMYAAVKDQMEYLSLAVYQGVMDTDHFTARYRSYRSENTLPTPDQPLALEAGELLAVSVKAGESMTLYSNDPTVSSTLHQGVILNDAQLDQVDVARRKNGWLFPLESTETELTFDLPTDRADIVLRYRLERTVNGARNADCWGLRGVNAVRDGQVLYPVVAEGNWELSIMLTGAPDFIGGRQHGSEVQVNQAIRLDGKPWKPKAASQLCRELMLEERTALYDPSDEVTQVAWHDKQYLITAEGIDIRQSVSWLRDAECSYSYVCMLPIARGGDAVTPAHITERCRDDLDFADYDISQPGFSGRPHQKRHGVARYWLWSDETGVAAEVECRMEHAPEESVSFVQNTADLYNKVYYSYCGEQYAVQAGDVWRWQQHYRLNIRGMQADVMDGTQLLCERLDALEEKQQLLPRTDVFRTHTQPYAAFVQTDNGLVLRLGFPMVSTDPTDTDVFVVGRSHIGRAHIKALP